MGCPRTTPSRRQAPALVARALALFATCSLSLPSLAAGKEACCWCGKSYEPLPGYWEGAGEANAYERLHVALAPPSSLVVVIPRSFYNQG